MKENTAGGPYWGFLLIPAIMFFLSCDSFLPEDFQEKDFTEASLASVDATAHTVLTDTAIVPVAIDASTSDSLDSLIADSVTVSPGETNWTISMPEDTGYVAFENGGTATTVFFADEIVAMVMTENGSVVEPSSEHIPLETLAYAPEIKGRFGYGISSGQEYLIRFVTSASSFHLVILEEE